MTAVRLVDADDLAGVAELAIALGISRQVVCNLASRHPKFPREITRFAMGPVYSMRAVRAFARDCLALSRGGV